MYDWRMLFACVFASALYCHLKGQLCQGTSHECELAPLGSATVLRFGHDCSNVLGKAHFNLAGVMTAQYL